MKERYQKLLKKFFFTILKEKHFKRHNKVESCLLTTAVMKKKHLIMRVNLADTGRKLNVRKTFKDVQDVF